MRIEGKRKGKATPGQTTKKSRPDLNLSDLDMQNIASYVLPTQNTTAIPSRESLFCDSCDTSCDTSCHTSCLLALCADPSHHYEGDVAGHF